METVNQYLFAIVALACLVATLIAISIRYYRKLKLYESKYSAVISVDEAVIKSQKELKAIEIDIEKIRRDYKKKRIVLTAL